MSRFHNKKASKHVEALRGRTSAQARRKTGTTRVIRESTVSRRMAEGGQRGKKLTPLDLPDEPSTQRISAWITESSGATERRADSEGLQEGRRRKVTTGEGVEKEKARRGRPTKAESLKRERRRNSASSTLSSFSIKSSQTKRGRESGEEGSEEEREKERPAVKKEKKTGETREAENKEKEEMEAGKMMEAVLQQMKEIAASLEEKITTSKEETCGKMEEFKEEMKQYMMREVEKISTEFKKKEEERTAEMDQLRKEVAELRWREEARERREKKQNIVIWGAQGQGGNAKQIAMGVFKQINEEIQIEEVKKASFIGRNENKGIVVELEHFEEKKKLMRGKTKLKGGNIYLDDDLTRNEREMQRKIREWAKRMRVGGKRVNVGYGRGFVDEKEYVWNEETGSMEERTFRRERMEQEN